MRERKILFHYVIRYFLGFLTAFFCSVLVAQMATEILKEDVVERSTIKMEQGVQNIRSLLTKLELVDQMLSRNPSFAMLAQQTGEIARNKVTKLKDANQLLSEISFAADNIPYIFVLFADNNMYLSGSQCSFRFTDYYPKFLTLIGKEQSLAEAERLKSYLFARYQSRDNFVALKSISFWYGNKRQQLNEPLLYMPRHGAGAQPSYLSCFLLDKEYLVKQILTTELQEDAYLRIEDEKNGELLLEYGKFEQNRTEAKALPEEIESGNSEYHIIVKNQEDLGWEITAGLPLSFIYEQLKPVRQLLYFYLIVGMAVVILLTITFSLQRYRKLKQLLFSLPSADLAEGKEKAFDEYPLLLSRIVNLKNQGNRYRQDSEQLIRQNEVILLEHLIISGIKTPAERRVFEKCFQRQPEFFCVVIVRIEDKNILSYEQLSMDMSVFLEAHYSEKFANVYSGVNDELFLMEVDRSKEANTQEIYELFKELTLQLTARYDAVFHVGISAIGTDIANIHKCYEQAKQMVQAQYLYTNENMIKAYDISFNSAFKNPVNPDFLNHLYNYLIGGQREEALRSIFQLERYYAQTPYLFETQKQQLYYSIRNIFFSAWLALNASSDFAEIMAEFDSEIPFRAIFDSFKQAVCELSDFMNQNRKSQNQDLKNKIIQYLHENYQNPSLSAYIVSHAMGISEKYLFQFIKEQTGKTFAAYLLDIRIAKAREYLKTKALSNEKIAELTGFGSVNTFYRNFKAQTGVSPKLYQESVGANSDDLIVSEEK